MAIFEPVACLYEYLAWSYFESLVPAFPQHLSEVAGAYCLSQSTRVLKATISIRSPVKRNTRTTKDDSSILAQATGTIFTQLA